MSQRQNSKCHCEEPRRPELVEGQGATPALCSFGVAISANRQTIFS